MPHKPRPSTTGPAESVGPLEKITPADAVQESAAAGAVGRIKGATAATPVQPAAAVHAPAGTERVRDLADRLKRGDINPTQAVEALIDGVLHDNLEGIGGPAGEELRTALAAYAEADPFLQSRIRRLSKV